MLKGSNLALDVFNKYIIKERFYSVLGYAHQSTSYAGAPSNSQNDVYLNFVYLSATGFNFNATTKNTVPPHIDVDTPLYFNLLIPVFGIAKLNLFETIPEHLEFRHGLSHWKMQQNGSPRKKIGELVVDKPVLLDTNILHDVEPIDTPRCVWCTRWIDIPRHFTYKTFKRHVENIL